MTGRRMDDKQGSLKSAVAITYGQTDAAPRVVAKGRGLIAEQIIQRAREHGVYVHESPELVSLLMQIDLDQRIPPQLYVAVSELLAWLYRLESGQTVSEVPLLSALPESLDTAKPAVSKTRSGP